METPSYPDSIFSPSMGVQPPVLAGREKQKQTLMEMTAKLSANMPPLADAQIIGPRGTGKTCLKTWFADQISKHLEQAVCCQISANQTSSIDKLAQHLLRSTAKGHLDTLKRLLPNEISIGSENAKASWQIKYKDDEFTFELALAEAARECPLIVCIDEAHNLAPDFVHDLANLSQNLKSTHDAPFLLVLVGTPELARTLSTAKATFLERCEKLRLGLLEHEDAVVALTKPFADRNIEFPTQLVDATLDPTQNYPYFIQVIGRSLERALKSTNNIFDENVLGFATEDFHEQTRGFYKERHAELQNNHVIAAALSISRLYLGARNNTFTDVELKEHVQSDIQVSAEEAYSMVEVLKDKGFVWDRVPEDYEAGIPSLMTHILEVNRSRLSGLVEHQSKASSFGDEGMTR